eukprot:4638807-Pyramimonas_sp.AAC.1
MRRLHGATIADYLGPTVEPGLSQHQAARKGGQCGPNIAAVSRYLSHGTSADPGPGRCWRELLGSHRDAVQRYLLAAETRLGAAPSPA